MAEYGAGKSQNKIKILKLMEILRQRTDEQHPMTTNQLVAELGEMGIPGDRRTLSQDISALTEAGCEVMSTIMGHEKAYYVADRRFSVPERKILIGAVHAASFITEKKSEQLIGKIADLAGTYRSEALKRNMVCFNTRKHSNERVFTMWMCLRDKPIFTSRLQKKDTKWLIIMATQNLVLAEACNREMAAMVTRELFL